jgi:hypothetical protein
LEHNVVFIVKIGGGSPYKFASISVLKVLASVTLPTLAFSDDARARVDSKELWIERT